MAARKRRPKFNVKNVVVLPWEETVGRVWAFGANGKPCLWVRSPTSDAVQVFLQRKFTTFGICLYVLNVIDRNDHRRSFTYDDTTPSKAKRLADKDLKKIGILLAGPEAVVLL